jgi:FixJ family two-component response regulator
MTMIYLVDDDPSARQGLARLIRAAGHTVVTFASARAFLDAGPPAGPGCVVLDVRMPEVSGLDLQERLARGECPLPVIFITGHGDIPMSVQAMKQGAVDFLPKPVDGPQLLAAIQQALEKDAATRRQLKGRQDIRRRLEQLTERERDVMALVIRGRLNKQVAAELGIAEPTVKIHRGRVMEKLEVASVAELVLLAQQAGLTAAGTTRPASAAPISPPRTRG